jgi:hypothetical protein
LAKVTFYAKDVFLLLQAKDMTSINSYKVNDSVKILLMVDSFLKYYEDYHRFMLVRFFPQKEEEQIDNEAGEIEDNRKL